MTPPLPTPESSAPPEAYKNAYDALAREKARLDTFASLLDQYRENGDNEAGLALAGLISDKPLSLFDSSKKADLQATKPKLYRRIMTDVMPILQDNIR